ncbi:MAG: branched-chain amino acid ABC transporter permease [Acidimicrobiales bacterium]
MVSTGRGPLGAVRISVLVVAAMASPALANAFGGSFGVYALTIGTVEAFAVLGSNLVGGFLEQPNLAMGCFVAVGAYTTGTLMTDAVPFVFAFLGGVALAAVGAGIVGVLTVRLRGIQTALVTFALAWALPSLLDAMGSLTGGSAGKEISATPTLVFSFASGSLALAYLAIVLFIVVAMVFQFAMNRRPGRLVVGVAQSEAATTAFGIRSKLVRVVAGCAAGALAGVAGALYAPAVGYLSSQQFTFQFSLLLFVGTIVGGRRSVLGAWIGGLVVGMLPQVLSTGVGGAELVLFGAILLAAVLGVESGIAPELEMRVARAWRWARRRGHFGE